MFEKVNPRHPDKVADRIAGALVDLAYRAEANPRIAVEVLIGHGVCHIIAETSVKLSPDDVTAAVHRIDRKYVYSYFTVEDVRHIHVGDKMKFISHDKTRDKQGAILQVFDIATGRTTYGDKTYFTVKCKVIEDPHDLLIDTIGTVEFEIK